MNIKVMLVEKERAEYIEGRTEMASFLGATLDYIAELEKKINDADRQAEEEFSRIQDRFVELSAELEAMRREAARDRR